MHNLILKELQNQHHEIVELKRVLAILSGKEIFALEEKELPDIKSLHPRGIERFANDSLRKRWQANICHNALVSTIRQELSVTGDDN